MDDILQGHIDRIKELIETSSYDELILAQNKRLSALALKAARMALPEHFRRVVAEQWHDTDTYLKCLQGLGSGFKKGKGFLIAHGPTGTGKTSAVCQLAVKMAVSAKIRTNNLFFLNTFESEIASYAPTGWPTMYRQASAAGILILDDLGVERYPNRVQAIISKRYDQHGWLLCTTNHNPKRLAEIYGVRIMRRLEELGTFIECDKNAR